MHSVRANDFDSAPPVFNSENLFIYRKSSLISSRLQKRQPNRVAILGHRDASEVDNRPVLYSQEADAIVRDGPAARQEASLFIESLIAEARRFETVKDFLRPVTLDISKIMHFKAYLPEKCLRFHEGVESPFLDILSIGLVPIMLSIVSKVADRNRYVGRVIGSMGEGKSYACLVAYMKSLTSYWEDIRLCYIPDPIKMLEKPYLLLETLLVVFHDHPDPSFVEDLKKLYIETRKNGAMSSIPGRTVVDILKMCFDQCETLNKRFVILLDQENKLYRKPYSHLESLSYAAFIHRPGPERYEFCQNLISGAMAHATILVSSDPSEAVRLNVNPSVKLVRLPAYTNEAESVGSSMLNLLEHSGIVDRGNILAWRDFFFQEMQHVHSASLVPDDDASKWAHFIDKVEKLSFKNPLETVKILEYLSGINVTDAQASPWQGYYSSKTGLLESHVNLMSEQLGNFKSGSEHTAYLFLLSFLDFHLFNSESAVEQASKFLWKQIDNIIGPTLDNPEKFFMGKIEKFIDSRFMVVEYGKTPRSTSMLGRFILTSLPNSVLRHEKSFFEHLLPLSLYPHLHGYFMKHGLREKLWAIAFQITFLMPHNDGPVATRQRSLLAKTVIRPQFKIYFRPDGVEADMMNLINFRNQNVSQWAVMIPAMSNNNDVDFALLYLPSRLRPPVLFPIQVTMDHYGHGASDSIFRNNPLNHPDHPLMTAFRKFTNGRGRVQFIWVLRDPQETRSASKSKSFDTQSWFTAELNWDTKNIGKNFLTDKLLAKIDAELPRFGYECGLLA